MTTFNDAVFSRGYETPDDVTVTRPVAETNGLQPEDLGVLVHLLLLPSDTSAAAKDLAAGMRALGWKMSVDRFEVIAKRLTKAGHLLRKSVYNPETKRPQWRYWAYRNPAKNPGYAEAGTGMFPQVRAEVGENPFPAGVVTRETGENPVSPGQSGKRVFPDFAPETGKTRFPSDAVSAGQDRNREEPGSVVSPPTPPLSREEEDSSSLDPSTASGRVAGLDGAAVTAAGEFLALLPGRWACGRKTAARLAPLLAEAVASQGWALGPALVAQLTRRARGKTAEAAAVLAERIEDLPLYRATRAQVPGEQMRGPVAQQLPLDGSSSGQPVPASAITGVQPTAAQAPAEQVAEAKEVLLSLTAPWHVGPGDAERLAPLLAATVAERGWTFGEQLRQQLMSNPGGGSNYLWLLEHKRIAALPVRRKWSARGTGNGVLPRQAAIDACPRCDAYGQFEVGDRYALCRHDVQPDRTGVPGQSAAPRTPADPVSPTGSGAEPDAALAVGPHEAVVDVAAYALAMVTGMSPQAALGMEAPQLGAEERERLAAQTEEERRHEAHNHALHVAP